MATAAASGRLTRAIRRSDRAGLRIPWAVVRGQVLARPAWLALAVILLFAAALRLIPWLAVYPLHHDEALYGTWGRLIASGRDPFLLTPWVDKPPLGLYLIAASFRLFGVSELALRLPGMIAGLLTVWATYGLARQMHRASRPLRVKTAGRRSLLRGCVPGQAPASGFAQQQLPMPRGTKTAGRRSLLRGCVPGQAPASGFAQQHRSSLFAAALLALSPFAMLFAPTAFTDPWLTLWLVAAAWAARSGRPLLAGLAAGLAVASKQQGVFVVPLVLALLMADSAVSHVRHGVTADNEATRNRAFRRSGALRSRNKAALAALGFALAFAPLTWWDSLRWHNRPSFWERSLDTYGGLGLAAPVAWPGRAVEWAEPLGYLFGTPALSAVILALAALGGATGARPARILGLFVTGYLALHVAVTFQPWDRYLLPILPLVCVLAAQGVTTAVRWLHNQVSEGTRMNADTCTHLQWPQVRRERGKDLILSSPSRGRGMRPRKNIARDWNRGSPALAPERSAGASASRSLSLSIKPPEGSIPSRRHVPGRVTSRVLLYPLAIALAVIVAHAAWLGAAGRIPIGSDYGAYRGVDRAAAALAALPADAVIYYHAIGWHLDFYLFDAPQERRWYDTAGKLARDGGATARTKPGRPQWLVLPAWETPDAATLQAALAGEGLRLVTRDRIARDDGQPAFTLYQMTSLAARGEP